MSIATWLAVIAVGMVSDAQSMAWLRLRSERGLFGADHRITFTCVTLLSDGSESRLAYTACFVGKKWRVDERDFGTGVVRDVMWDGSVLTLCGSTGPWLIAPPELLVQHFGRATQLFACPYWEALGVVLPNAPLRISDSLQLIYDGVCIWDGGKRGEEVTVVRRWALNETRLWWLDGSRGGAIVGYELWSAGTLRRSVACEDWRMVDGIRVPFRLTVIESTGGSEARSAVTHITVDSVEVVACEDWLRQRDRRPGEFVLDGRYCDRTGKKSVFVEYCQCASPAVMIEGYEQAGVNAPARMPWLLVVVGACLVVGIALKSMRRQGATGIVFGALLCSMGMQESLVAQERPTKSDVTATLRRNREGLSNLYSECSVADGDKTVQRMAVAVIAGVCVSLDSAHCDALGSWRGDYLRNYSILSRDAYTVEWPAQRAYESRALDGAWVPDRFKFQFLFTATGWWPGTRSEQAPRVLGALLDVLQALEANELEIGEVASVDGEACLLLVSSSHLVALAINRGLAVKQREWLDANMILVRRLRITDWYQWEHPWSLPREVVMDKNPLVIEKNPRGLPRLPDSERYLNARFDGYAVGELKEGSIRIVPQAGALEMKRGEKAWHQIAPGGLEILDEVGYALLQRRDRDSASLAWVVSGGGLVGLVLAAVVLARIMAKARRRIGARAGAEPKQSTLPSVTTNKEKELPPNRS